MSRFWRCLEELRGQVAVPAGWRLWLDGEFEGVRGAFLRARPDFGKSVPCPHGCGCMHEAIPRGDGSFVGVCRCDSWNCDDIPLKKEDLVLLELNRSKLGRAIAWAFECEPREVRWLVPGAVQVACYGERATSVFLTLPEDRDEFQQGITALVAQSSQPFILFGPTNRFVDSRCRELLEKRGAEYFDLESNVEIGADGELRARRPARELFARFLPGACGRPPVVPACGLADTGQTAVRTSGEIPDFFIRQEGTRRRAGKQDRTEVSTWRIWFRGHEVLMPTWVGTDYLVFLMISQGREFDAGELTQAIRKSAGAGDARSKAAAGEILHGQDGYGEAGEATGGRVGELNERDVIWDERQIAECLRRLQELGDAVQEYEEAGDRGDGYGRLKEKLEQQQDLLAANAKQVNGKWLPKEYQKGTFQQKAEVIRKHVRKVLDEHLRENCRPLYDHLNDRDTLVYGVKNRYQPKPRVNWVVELKGDKTGM